MLLTICLIRFAIKKLITKIFEKTSKLYCCERLLSIFLNNIRKALIAKRNVLNEYNVKKHLK